MYTCSYPTRGLLKTDYLRSKFSETDILSYQHSKESACTNTIEYINIGGKDCTNCATSIGQGGGIFHINTYNVNCGGLVNAYVGVCSDGTPVTLFGVYIIVIGFHSHALWIAHQQHNYGSDKS
jgi:hypothetical protein